MSHVLVLSSSANRRAAWSRALTGVHTTTDTLGARSGDLGATHADAVVVALPDRPVAARRVLTGITSRHPDAAVVAVLQQAPPDMTRWLRGEGVTVVVSDAVTDATLRQAVDAALRTAASDRSRGGRVAMDPMRQQAIVAGRRVTLSQREFSLYAYLLQKAGHVCTRTELLDTVWGLEFDPGSNIVDVAVRRLRRKVGSHELIETIRNVGYRLVA